MTEFSAVPAYNPILFGGDARGYTDYATYVEDVP
ncbi:MAG: hypothetical protein AW11_04043 [Candidatus Accumulibacter regalis]|jgi:hypothetical protein|uniref:Uncharacterized protein n=1 Tax=Accumulibacter regalis TaxID=522306 RepID=A0A011P8X1_ACCRE|nr:MAG: hypothetical protein AW11_04043 [Candidatus Accumulibacter regalis]